MFSCNQKQNSLITSLTFDLFYVHFLELISTCYSIKLATFGQLFEGEELRYVHNPNLNNKHFDHLEFGYSFQKWQTIPRVKIHLTYFCPEGQVQTKLCI